MDFTKPFRFATCDRKNALRFLKGFYPKVEINDEGPVSEVLDLVQSDTIRIPDPSLHPEGTIIPSRELDKIELKDVVGKLQTMHDLLTAA